MAHQQYQNCIDACNACAAECEHCVTACLDEVNVDEGCQCICREHSMTH